MNTNEKVKEYAQKIKASLLRVDENGDNIWEMSHSTKEIEAILEPVFSVIETVEKDAGMALDGSWDCTTDEGIETGFNAQIELINKL